MGRMQKMFSREALAAQVRLIDSCITQLKAQGPSRTCNESREEEEEDVLAGGLGRAGALLFVFGMLRSDSAHV